MTLKKSLSSLNSWYCAHPNKEKGREELQLLTTISMLFHLLDSTFQSPSTRQKLRHLSFFHYRLKSKQQVKLLDCWTHTNCLQSLFLLYRKIQLIAEMERISPQAWKSGSSSIQGWITDLFCFKAFLPWNAIKTNSHIFLTCSTRRFKCDWHWQQ